VEFDNARVLVTDMKIEAIKDIIPILEQISRLNQPLLIIAVRAAVALVCAAGCMPSSIGLSVLQPPQLRGVLNTHPAQPAIQLLGG